MGIITLAVCFSNLTAGKPEATLSVGLFPWDGKWTLTCFATKSQSTWKYFWYRGEERSEFLPTQGFAVSNEIHVSQTGLYWCRGGRGDPVYYTEFSEPLKVGTNGEFSFTICKKIHKSNCL